MKTLLIDGDPLVFLSCQYAGNGPQAVIDARHSVDKLMEKLHADRPIICLSDQSRRYFRHGIWPGYKPNPSPRSVHHAHVVESLPNYYPVRCLPTLEADDVIGILATCGTLQGDLVIVADDHDLLTVPGKHYRPKRGDWLDVAADEADLRHLTHAIVGDTNKGVPGCPGVGDKKADLLMRDAWVTRSAYAAWRDVVVPTFVRHKLAEADAIAQAQLARVLRAGDYDHATGTVRPWQPPVSTNLFDKVPS